MKKKEIIEEVLAGICFSILFFMLIYVAPIIGYVFGIN